LLSITTAATDDSAHQRLFAWQIPDPTRVDMLSRRQPLEWYSRILALVESKPIVSRKD